MIPILLLALAVTLPPPSTPGTRYSAERLVADRIQPQGTTLQDLSPRQVRQRIFADGYLSGIADATEGTVWCDPHTAPPHEIDAEILWAITEMPADQVKGRAAPIVISLLAIRYPCPRKEKP